LCHLPKLTSAGPAQLNMLMSWPKKAQHINSSGAYRSRMRLEDWWYHWHLEELLESYLPDFVLAFTFFTSVVYAVLGKRFEQQ